MIKIEKKMKKTIVLLFAFLTLTNFAQAQTDAKAKAILAAVSKKYRTFDVVKADFSFVLDNQQAKLKEQQEGTLLVKAKANKYKVSMDDQVLISDGKSQWTYLKADKEVQVTEVDNSNEALNPARIFTMYENGYKYLYTGDSKIGGRVYQMIDLSPLDTKKSFFKIRLSIDKVAKQIANVLIFDKNGNKYTYKVKSFAGQTNIPESTFVFDTKKYPGVEVVDLR